MLKLIQELIQGESGGLSQLQLDLVNASLVQARQGLSDEVADFRDQLEALKVSLGLSPHAPVILDRQSVAAFPRVSEQVQGWQSRADRSLRELSQLIERLPALREVTVGGRPILALMGGNPDQQEEVLTRAARFAIQNRSDIDKVRLPEMPPPRSS